MDIVHGVRVSQIQRKLCEMLDGKLNYPFGRYNIDVALNIGSIAIAVEYDSWFWHGHQQNYDDWRDEQLIVANWHVLRIKSNSILPTSEQLQAAIKDLIAGKKRVEIILDDWGKGSTRFEIPEPDASRWTQPKPHLTNT